jgi:hypothetical protein
MKILRINTFLALLTLITCQTQAALPSWLTQTGNVIRKHPVLITGAATVAGISLAGVAGWYLWNQHKSREKKKLDPVEREKKEREAFFENGYDKLPDIEKDFGDDLKSLSNNEIEFSVKDPRSENPMRFFENLRKDVISKNELIKNTEKSKVIANTNTSEWVSSPRRLMYAYIDPNKDYYTWLIQLESDNSFGTGTEAEIEKFEKEYQAHPISAKEKKLLQHEVIESMAQEYKIHFQPKPEYLIDFVKELHDFMAHDVYGKYIFIMKVIPLFIRNHNVPGDKKTPLKAPYPIIVAYLPLIPGDKQEKNKLLANIINAILAHFRKSKFKDKLSEISLGITPRGNRHIKDFLYLAQGAYDDKKRFPPTPKYHCSNIYTEDMAFFKGYEFDIGLIK